MFDGNLRIDRSGPRRPVPPRPAPIDVAAMLPMLRTEAAEASLEFLAVATGANVVVLMRWLSINWGPDADLCDPGHPARAEALDPSSPPWKLAMARDALSTACWRYRMSTGGDGLALARQHLVRLYGASVADYALNPLVTAAAEDAWLDDLLMENKPKSLPRGPEPSPAERTAAKQSVAAWALSDPDMGDLQRHLEALRAAYEVEEAGDPHGQATVAALAAVHASIQSALWRAEDTERMYTAELVQVTLDAWSAATGGPHISIQVGDPPAPLP